MATPDERKAQVLNGMIKTTWSFFENYTDRLVAEFYMTPPQSMLNDSRYHWTADEEVEGGIRCWKEYPSEKKIDLNRVWMFMPDAGIYRLYHFVPVIITETIPFFHPEINFYRPAIGYGKADRVRIQARKVRKLKYLNADTIVGECYAFSRRQKVYCTRYKARWRWDSDLEWRKNNGQ